jgi:Predicted metal-dependent hydrolase of the TIM-barrel fold
MFNGIYTIDFHTHLQDTDDLQQMACHEDRTSALFRKALPIFDRVAGLTEPVTDHCVNYVALNYRGPLSRTVYAQMGAIGLMELLRLFKTYGVERLIAKMDHSGIDHSVIHSIEPYTSTANLLQITEPYRDRLSIFASVEKDREDKVGYLYPFIESGLVKGIKFHPIVGGYECGEMYFRMKDVVKLAGEADLPIMIHTGHIPVDKLKGIGGCTETEALEPLIREFPEVRFVLAHIGWESWRQVLELASRYPNTYVETSWQPANIIRRAVDRLGSSRVLFGSDFPLFKQSLALKHVREALTPREYVDVVSVNAKRLLKLDGKRSSANQGGEELKAASGQ